MKKLVWFSSGRLDLLGLLQHFQVVVAHGWCLPCGSPAERMCCVCYSTRSTEQHYTSAASSVRPFLPCRRTAPPVPPIIANMHPGAPDNSCFTNCLIRVNAISTYMVRGLASSPKTVLCCGSCCVNVGVLACVAVAQKEGVSILWIPDIVYRLDAKSTCVFLRRIGYDAMRWCMGEWMSLCIVITNIILCCIHMCSRHVCLSVANRYL